MTTYEVGQTATVRLRVTSDGTTLADLGGGNPVCTVTKPDGTTAAATVTHTGGTGLYDGALVTTQAGRHRYNFTGSGANSGGLPYTEVIDVWPADPRFIIGLADARAAINEISGTADDDELRLYMAAVTPVIEDIVGPVLGASKVWPADGGKEAILIPHEIDSITSVTEDGQVLTEGADYVVNYSAGVIYRGQSLARLPWMPGVQNVVVTYKVGGTAIDPNVLLAAREELRFLFQNGQQGGARPGLGDTAGYDLMVSTPSGFAVPRHVLELCQASAYHRMPGFA